jgi:hypothetical protein
VPTLSRSATGAGAKAEAKPLPDDRQTGNPLGAKKGHASWNLLVLGGRHSCRRQRYGTRTIRRWSQESAEVDFSQLVHGLYIYIHKYTAALLLPVMSITKINQNLNQKELSSTRVDT